MGAWWLGFIVNGTVILLSCIPFWFLPKSLPKQGQEESQSKGTELAPVVEQESFLPEENQDHGGKEKQPTFQELAKGAFQHTCINVRCQTLDENGIKTQMSFIYFLSLNCNKHSCTAIKSHPECYEQQ